MLVYSAATLEKDYLWPIERQQEIPGSGEVKPLKPLKIKK